MRLRAGIRILAGDRPVLGELPDLLRRHHAPRSSRVQHLMPPPPSSSSLRSTMIGL
jgi:hypothetical protein